MKKTVFFVVALCLMSCFTGCSTNRETESDSNLNSTQTIQAEEGSEDMEQEMVSEYQNIGTAYTESTKIADVISDPVFGAYGRLIFPVESGYYSGDTLGGLHIQQLCSANVPNAVAKLCIFHKRKFTFLSFAIA